MNRLRVEASGSQKTLARTLAGACARPGRRGGEIVAEGVGLSNHNEWLSDQGCEGGTAVRVPMLLGPWLRLSSFTTRSGSPTA